MMPRIFSASAKLLMTGGLLIMPLLAGAADFCEIDFAKRAEQRRAQEARAQEQVQASLYQAATAQDFIDAYVKAFPEDKLLAGKPQFDFEKNTEMFPPRAIDSWVAAFMNERAPNEPSIYKFFPDRSYIIRKGDGSDYRGMNMQHASFLVIGGIVRQLSVDLTRIKLLTQQRHKSGLDGAYAELSKQLASRSDYEVASSVRELEWQIRDTRTRLSQARNIDDVPVLQNHLSGLETKLAAARLIKKERTYRSYLVAATSRLERMVKDHFAQEEAMLRKKSKESWNLSESLEKHFEIHDKMEAELLTLTKGANALSSAPDEINEFGKKLYTGLSAWLNLHIKVYDTIEYNRPADRK